MCTWRPIYSANQAVQVVLRTLDNVGIGHLCTSLFVASLELHISWPHPYIPRPHTYIPALHYHIPRISQRTHATYPHTYATSLNNYLGLILAYQPKILTYPGYKHTFLPFLLTREYFQQHCMSTLFDHLP